MPSCPPIRQLLHHPLTLLTSLYLGLIGLFCLLKLCRPHLRFPLARPHPLHDILPV